MNVRVLLLPLLLAILSSSSTWAATAEAVAQQAVDLALHGEEEAAIEAYTSLLRDGHDGAALRYNLGTLHLQQGALGPAVLHLASAVRMNPDDDDAAYNLQVALQAREDRVSELRQTTWSLARLGDQLPRDLALWAFLLPLLLTCLWMASWPLQRRPLRWAPLLAPLLLIGAVSFGARVQAERRVRAVVFAEETSARVGPDPGAKVAFVAHAGLLGTIVDEQASTLHRGVAHVFVKLRLDNGLDVWLDKSDLRVLPQ